MESSEKKNKLTNIVSSKNFNFMREAPMNVGAEQALLGAILSNNLAFEKIEDFLEADFFF